VRIGTRLAVLYRGYRVGFTWTVNCGQVHAWDEMGLEKKLSEMGWEWG